MFGEGTHENLAGFLSPVFGKVKTTAGTNPRFMPVGVDIATRGILAGIVIQYLAMGEDKIRVFNSLNNYSSFFRYQ